MSSLRNQAPRPRWPRNTPSYPRGVVMIIVAAGMAGGCSRANPALVGDIAPAFDSTDAANTISPMHPLPPSDAGPVMLGGAVAVPYQPQPAPSR